MGHWCKWAEKRQKVGTRFGTYPLALLPGKAHYEDMNYKCSGDGPATHTECDFTCETESEAMDHFEATSHCVDELPRAAMTNDTLRACKSGKCGWCTECAEHYPAPQTTVKQIEVKSATGRQ